jgi:hypothetical protein
LGPTTARVRRGPWPASPHVSNTRIKSFVRLRESHRNLKCSLLLDFQCCCNHVLELDHALEHAYDHATAVCRWLSWFPGLQDVHTRGESRSPGVPEVRTRERLPLDQANVLPCGCRRSPGLSHVRTRERLPLGRGYVLPCGERWPPGVPQVRTRAGLPMG